MIDSPAIAFMLGDTSPEVLAGLREAMLRWSAQTGDRPMPLQRFTGMGGPRATRIAMRDELLIEAAALLSGSQWARCCELAKAAVAFNVRRWPLWQRHGVPPTASAVDCLLFRACELGEPLPETSHQWRSILLKQNASAA